MWSTSSMPDASHDRPHRPDLEHVLASVLCTPLELVLTRHWQLLTRPWHAIDALTAARRGGLWTVRPRAVDCARTEWRNEALTPDQAAEETGYSAEHLRRKIRDGTIPNAGEEGSPRVLRKDLPRKPGHRAERSASVEAASGQRVDSLTQEMRAVAES